MEILKKRSVANKMIAFYNIWMRRELEINSDLVAEWQSGGISQTQHTQLKNIQARSICYLC